MSRPPDSKKRKKDFTDNENDGLWDTDDDLDTLTQEQFNNIDGWVAGQFQQQTSIPRDSPAHTSGKARLLGRGSAKSLSESEVNSQKGNRASPVIPCTLRVSNQGNVQHKPALSFQQTMCTGSGKSLGFHSLSTTAHSTGSSALRMQPTPNDISLLPKPSSNTIHTFGCQTPQTTAPQSSDLSPELTMTTATSTMHMSLQRKLDDANKRVQDLEKDICKIRKEQLSKDGQINILKANLTTKESELTKERKDKYEIVRTNANERSKKEDSLQHEIERLQTELQFKERDLESETRKWKHTRVSTAGSDDSSNSSTPRVVLVPHSPLSTKAANQPKSPYIKNGKTSIKHSLQDPMGLAQNSSPHKVLKKEGHNRASSPVCKNSDKKGHQPEMKISDGGANQMVQHLLKGSYTSDGDSCPARCGGVMSLLNVPVKIRSMAGHVLQRDPMTNTLSPAKINQFVKISQSSSSGDTIVESESVIKTVLCGQENRTMAKEAMARLSACPADINTISLQTPAVMLIPLIEEYITAYIHMLQSMCSSTLASPSASSTSASGSASASLDSITSSMGELLSQDASHANHLEQVALNALKTLRTLVGHSAAVRFCILCDGDLAQDIRETEQTQDNNNVNTHKVIRGVSTELRVTWSSFDNYMKQVIEDCKLLRKIVRLSNPYPFKRTGNAAIVEESLAILCHLVREKEGQDLQRLHPLLLQDSLNHCLTWSAQAPTCDKLRMLIQALELLTCLARSSGVVISICTQSEDCVLTCLYGLCACLPSDMSNQQCTALGEQVLELLSTIASSNVNGVMALLEANCSCSTEIVKSVLVLLHRLYTTSVNTGSTTHIVQVMRSGIGLLHIFSLHDPHQFNRQTRDVFHHYIELEAGLKKLFMEQGLQADHDLLMELLDSDTEMDDEDSMEEDACNYGGSGQVDSTNSSDHISASHSASEVVNRYTDSHSERGRKQNTRNS